MGSKMTTRFDKPLKCPTWEEIEKFWHIDIEKADEEAREKRNREEVEGIWSASGKDEDRRTAGRDGSPDLSEFEDQQEQILEWWKADDPEVMSEGWGAEGEVLSNLKEWLEKGKHMRLPENLSPELEELHHLCEDSEPGVFQCSCVQAHTIAENVEKAHRVYANYNFDHEHDRSLPIYLHRQQLCIDAEGNQVVVVQGPTGCGKSTQVPQYILDCHRAQGRYCNIIVTQPRKIAAIQLARRVASERGWNVGGVVGYQVAMDRNTSCDTMLTYMTTGTFREKLVHSQDMNEYTHVILDEVHQRDEESDFSLLLVKKFLASNSKHVHVMVMSASLHAAKFQKYFERSLDGGEISRALLNTVHGRSFPIAEIYLDDIKSHLNLTVPKPDKFCVENPHIPEQCTALVGELLQYFDGREEEERSLGKKERGRGSVLIFLPGMQEMKVLHNHLRRYLCTDSLKIMPLHSTIPIVDQQVVFEPVSGAIRKVILSTNIAESSITVPDVRYVIDFCLTKRIHHDTNTNYHSLNVEWASRANCIQRAGRTGRTVAGLVFRLVPKKFYYVALEDYDTPEIQRCSLDLLVLRTKRLNQGSPQDILKEAIDPPDISKVRQTMLALKEVGCIHNERGSAYNPDDGNLTFIGQVACDLPIDCRLAKLICLSHLFGCLDDCLTIVAAYSVKSIFERIYDPTGSAKLKSYSKMLRWSELHQCDAIAYLNAFRKWESTFESGAHGKSEEETWCKENGINKKTVDDLKQLREDLIRRLNKFNIRLPETTVPIKARAETEDDGVLILKCLLAGAFYPNFFLRKFSEREERENQILHKARAESFNLNRVIFLRNIPNCLYGNVVRQNLYRHTFHDGELEVVSDGSRGSSMFVEFKSIPGQEDYKIPTQVYLACLMRRSQFVISTGIHNQNTTRDALNNVENQMQDYADKHDLLVPRSIRTGRSVGKTDLPSAIEQLKDPASFTEEMTIIPVHIIGVGNFFAVRNHKKHNKELLNMSKELEHFSLTSLIQDSTFQNNAYFYISKLCVVRSQGGFWRCRIIAVHPIEEEVTVQYLDKGMSDSVHYCAVYEMPLAFASKPQLIFEVAIIHIAPLTQTWPHSGWSADALREFKLLLRCGVPVNVTIFSVVDNVCRVQMKNIKRTMLEKGLAECGEESRESQEDNDLRIALMQGEDVLQNLGAAPSRLNVDIPVLGAPDGGSRQTLAGPFSPLEATFEGLCNYTMSCTGTVVQNDSVNCITLDTHPFDKHHRLMVAANCTLKILPCKRKLILHNTCILPNIPGLPMILTLLFAPNVEMRLDKHSNLYTGAICGLGSANSSQNVNNHQRSRWPDHDMEVAFDVVCEETDMENVNMMRHMLSELLDFQTRGFPLQRGQLYQKQRSMREQMLRIIKQKRISRDLQRCETPYQWNKIPHDLTYFSKLSNISYHSAPILPQIAEVRQHPQMVEEFDERKAAEANITLFEQYLAQEYNRTMYPILCRLCDELIRYKDHLSAHVRSSSHLKEREDMLLLKGKWKP